MNKNVFCNRFFCSFFLCFILLHLNGQSIRDKENSLRRFTDEDGSLLVNLEQGRFIRYEENYFSQSTYDERMRLVEEVVFDTKTKEVFSLTTYIYEQNEMFPTRSEKTFPLNSEKEIRFYDDMGLLLRQEYWKTELVVLTNWTYDNKNRVIEEQVIYPVEHKENKVVYSYKKEFENPDRYWYENSVLIRQIEFQTATSYVEKIFFPDSPVLIREGSL